jgi:ATP-dependent helicase/nuclease subunit B
MVEFIIGTSGSGKTTQMFGRIRRSSEEMREQCILVPEQYSYEFDKTLYFYLGADKFNELFSLSFTSLARQLFQIYGEPGRMGDYADDLARMILIHQAVAAVQSRPEQLQYFRRQSTHNGFAEEVLKLINDMKRSGIEPEELLSKAEFTDGQLMDKTRDIAAIYTEYERLMSEYGFKDELDNIKEAAKTANLYGYFDGKDVYIDEFESFTGDQLEMLRVIIASADNVVITLRSDNVEAGDYTLFETVNNTYRKLRDICRELRVEYRITDCGRSNRFSHSDLEYLSERIMRNLRYEPENAPTPENIHIFEAKDMYSEAEYVCASIKRLISGTEGLMYRDIAVISNDITGYTEVLKAAFGRYGIPYFMSIEKSVAHTPIMVFVSVTLELISARKLRSEQIFRMLKCGILDISLTDTALLENYCYKWDVENEVWLLPFTAPDDDLELIEGLRRKIIEPITALRKQMNRNNTASNICGLLYSYLEECQAEQSIGRLMDRLISEDRDYEAAEQKRIWGSLMDILDSISDTLGEKEISFGEFSRIMRSMMGQMVYSVPPQTLDSVIAASARTARLNSPKVVFVMGCTDGDFPNQVNVHGLFSESDKQKLALRGIEVSRPLSDLIASERLIVYKALSSASEKLYVTYPLSDLSGQAKYPAQAVEQIMKIFGREDIRLTERDVPAHYYAVTYHSAYYHYMQGHRDADVSIASIKRVLTEDPEYRRRIAYVLSRSGYRQDYHIERSVMEKLKSFQPLRLSASGLEEYDLCHFKFFCDKCLRLQECEKVELDARVAGELTHDCFRGILSSRSKKAFLELSYDDIQREVTDCAKRYRSEKLAGDFGKNSRFELVFNKLTESISGVFMHTQQALMASDFVPRAYELNITKSSPVELPFGDGHRLVFGGTIDRVDTCEIGGREYIRIVDYKSSRKVITPTALGSGLNMQMLLYLFACTENSGIYKDCIPAGVLYSPIRIGSVDVEEHKVSERNINAVNASLKPSGLVLSDMKVLEAMEKGISGNYVPAKLTKSGELDSRSSCIDNEGMEKLRGFTYSKLTEMAESLLEGNAEAVPLKNGSDIPCLNCNYVDICGNSQLERYRLPDAESVAEAEALLGIKKKGEDD